MKTYNDKNRRAGTHLAWFEDRFFGIIRIEKHGYGFARTIKRYGLGRFGAAGIPRPEPPNRSKELTVMNSIGILNLRPVGCTAVAIVAFTHRGVGDLARGGWPAFGALVLQISGDAHIRDAYSDGGESTQDSI